MNRGLFCTFSFVILFFIGCGNPSQTYLNPYNSLGITRTTYSGAAQCNAVSVPGILDAETEHPNTTGSPDQTHLLVNVKTLASSFMSNQSNSIQLFRARYSLDANGNQQIFQDPVPLAINLVSSSGNSSTSITPASLQQANLNAAPFYFIITGTDVPWTEIIMNVMLNGSLSTGSFLIPNFDADPMLYRQAHQQYPALYQLHPFYKQMDVDQDYISLMQQYCF